jgi:hypothetical protein
MSVSKLSSFYFYKIFENFQLNDLLTVSTESDLCHLIPAYFQWNVNECGKN